MVEFTLLAVFVHEILLVPSQHTTWVWNAGFICSLVVRGRVSPETLSGFDHGLKSTVRLSIVTRKPTYASREAPFVLYVRLLTSMVILSGEAPHRTT